MVRSVRPSHGVLGLEGAAPPGACFRFDGGLQVYTCTLALLWGMAEGDTQIPEALR